MMNRMITLNAIAKIDQGGRMTIETVTAFPAGERQVEIRVHEPSQPDGTNIAAILKLAGTLEWKGDPMALQREMRDEWPD